MRRDGNPGDITVAIMSCNILDYYGGPWWDGYYAHMPTGNILTSVTVPEEDISEGFGWVEFSFNPYPLNGGDAYAIVTYAPNTSSTSRYIFLGYQSYAGYPTFGTPYLYGNQVFTWGGWQMNYHTPDLNFEVYGDPCSAGPSSTGSGTAGLMTSKGTVDNFTGVDDTILPGDKPEGYEYPHGFFDIDISGLTPGETVEFTFAAPSYLPEGTKWIKWDGDEWVVMDIESDDGDGLITVTITDNGPGDLNPIEGAISDPGGPGVPVVYEIPEAGFSAAPLTGEAPLTVAFTDISTGDIDTWSWDFDNDGYEDSALQNPSYVYNSEGIYTVSLTVSGLGGSDNETKLDYITVLSPAIMADLNIDPDVINLKSKGQWITAYIDLPDGYDIEDVDISSIILNDSVSADWADLQDDGESSLMVKFNLADVQELLSLGNDVEIMVSGQVTDGTQFEGYDTVRVK